MTSLISAICVLFSRPSEKVLTALSTLFMFAYLHLYSDGVSKQLVDLRSVKVRERHPPLAINLPAVGAHMLGRASHPNALAQGDLQVVDLKF